MKLLKKVFLCSVVLFGLTNLNANSSISSLENDPIFKDIQKLQEDMNRIFENFHKKYFEQMDMQLLQKPFFSPRADLKDRGKYYEIKVDLPGIDNAQTKVEVKDNILTITAKSERAKEQKDDKMIKQERFVGVFHKSLTLPKDADANKLKTDYKNGVLTIEIPKKR